MDCGSFSIPKLSQWIEYNFENNKLVLTVAKAQQMLWQKGQQEIQIIKENMNNLPGFQFDHISRSKIFHAFHFLFGPNSTLLELF